VDEGKLSWLFTGPEEAGPSGSSPPGHRRAVVCGPQGMLDTTGRALLAMGLREADIVLLDA
jgi:ferredoxin-NADP reductase